MFNEQDASNILKIPLSLNALEDAWFWIEDDKGIYSVKSGYRLLCKLTNQLPSVFGQFNWLKLWALYIPPKVKIFIWRVVHNCLPTLDNLQRRNVGISTLCPICMASMETLEHILCFCPFTTKCWELIQVNVQNNVGVSAGQWLSDLFILFSGKDLELFCSVAWNIWSHRNSVVWKNFFQRPAKGVNRASTFLFQWQNAPLKSTSSNFSNRREGVVVWQRPTPGWVTCNIDATVQMERNVSAFGCLIRNDHGVFLARYGGQLMGSVDPKVAEAMAFREALSWLKRLEISNVFIELDSLCVVQAMRKEAVGLSYFGSIIYDCSSIVKNLRSYSVYFVKWSANIASHTIAREACSMPDHKEWFFTPSFLIDVIANDIQ